MDEKDISAPSPNGEYVAILSYENETRFGQRYYSLGIDELGFLGRIFGKDYLWSPDSRYFAIQEWDSKSENREPDTQLLLIDVIARMECILSVAYWGWIIPMSFEGDRLSYTEEFSPGFIKEFEIEFLPLERWASYKKIRNYDRLLEGAEAIKHANEHLKKARVDHEKWEIEYVDEKTGERWLEDYPHSEYHGGGPLRLRRIKE